MKINLTVKGVVDISPDRLGRLFALMSADDQALFFSSVAYTIEKEYLAPSQFQFQYVTDSALLTNKARKLMAIIGEYAEKQ